MMYFFILIIGADHSRIIYTCVRLDKVHLCVMEPWGYILDINLCFQCLTLYTNRSACLHIQTQNQTAKYVEE